MLELDLIEPSYSPWSSPVTLVKKPDGSIRFCIDYRALNKITVSDQFPMPLMASIIQNLKGAKYLSSLDMTMGYFQCAVDEKDKIKTAFTCSAGLYQFKVLPFGLKCAPSTFNRLMSRVLREVYGTCAMAYLDDIVIFSHTFKQHLKDLETIFKILKRENLKIKLRKCQFCRVDFKFLGSIVREGRLQIDPDKILSIKTFQTPRNVKEVQRFLGLTGWLRKHVKEYAHISRPLSALTGGKNPKKSFYWSKQCQESFELLKTKLIEPGTALPLPFIIECDAADHGIAGVLCQKHRDDSFHVIEYASCILHPREANYTISEKELLAVIYSIAKFKAYIADKPFKIITDHNALRWLLKTKDLSGRLTRWALKLQEYDYIVEYRKGAEHLIPDALSRGTTIEEAFNPDDEDERMSPPLTNSIVNAIEIKLNFSDVTPEEIREEQLKEKWIAEMIDRIKTIIIKNDEQFFLKKYYILKDMLFYKSNKDSDEYRIVLPCTLINKVLVQFHNDPTGGHFGIQKTLLKVQSRIFWHHMKDDVITFVKTCHTCQMTKSANTFLRGPMQCNYVSRPMELWGIDIMGPYVRSTRQNKFLLVIVDHYTKWLEVFPMRNSTTNVITQHITECMGRYGIPERLLSDNGPQFVSNLYKKLCEVWNVKNIHSTFYHPSANFVENTNKTIKRLLRSYVDDNQAAWDVHIPQFLLAIRTTVNVTTGFTPARLFIGRELPLPWDTTNHTKKGSDNFPRYIQNMEDTNRDIQQTVDTNMRQHKQRQKLYYDEKTRSKTFEVGDRVKVKNFTLSDATKKYTSKLAPVWKGPFIITRKINDLVYHLKDTKNNDVGTWNIANLESYYGNREHEDGEKEGAIDPLPIPFSHTYGTRSRSATLQS